MALTRSWPKRLTFRMSAELHQRIKVDCARRGLSMNDAMVELLEREYPEPTAKPAKHRTVRAEERAP